MNTIIRFGVLFSLVLLLAGCAGAATPAAQTSVPTSAQPVVAPSASAAPAATAAANVLPTAPVAQDEALQYMWPGTLPQQMQLDAGGASASADGFVLAMSAPGTQWSATITGGSSSQAAQLPPTVTQPVTVRGHAGVGFSTGAGWSLFWQEDGQHYAVLGTLSLDDALALANGLQPLDRASWLANVE